MEATGEFMYKGKWTRTSQYVTERQVDYIWMKISRNNGGRIQRDTITSTRPKLTNPRLIVTGSSHPLTTATGIPCHSYILINNNYNSTCFFFQQQTFTQAQILYLMLDTSHPDGNTRTGAYIKGSPVLDLLVTAVCADRKKSNIIINCLPSYPDFQLRGQTGHYE
jgi:hypothetical protein